MSPMHSRQRWNIEVDSQGRLVLPPDLAQRLGLVPGTRTLAEAGENELHLLRPISHLARLYIEPTNICNLDCLTCMRNVWDEPLGRMSLNTFEQVCQGLQAFSPIPMVFLGGFGEPLAHPQILPMIRRLKSLGAAVEMITNATLLDEACAAGLVQAGLDRLWVSIDGADPESYEDVRLGAALPQVLENVRRLVRLRDAAFETAPQLGIAFVAMQRNIRDLPAVLQLGTRLGASHFSVSNVLSHTPDLHQHELYSQALYAGASQFPNALPSVNLPRLDQTPEVQAALAEALNGSYNVRLAGGDVGHSAGRCPFIERGSAAVRWDGSLSPCLPLLHTHDSYLDERLHRTHAHTVGNVNERSLFDLWQDPAYVALRQRLQVFDFSPCTFCNTCEMPDHNQEDCYANPFPTCGGCLWAQGLIQCP